MISPRRDVLFCVDAATPPCRRAMIAVLIASLITPLPPRLPTPCLSGALDAR